MSKRTGILIDPDTGDLRLSLVRDRHGLITEGLEIGETAYQNQALILQAFKGEFKEHPVLGAGISDMVCDHETAGWKREIAIQLESDGMKINECRLDINDNKLTIDATYDS
ncbi:MAG: hypothetical protein K2L01_06960 [Rikenellaceae bacterium]|nr:hypothetical protein [Rikenellaceae bacterium]